MLKTSSALTQYFVLDPSGQKFPLRSSFKKRRPWHYNDKSYSPTVSLMSVSGPASETMIIICAKSERSSLSSADLSWAITHRAFPVLFHVRGLSFFSLENLQMLYKFCSIYRPFILRVTKQLLPVADISLSYLRHHYLRRQNEVVAPFPKNGIGKLWMLMINCLPVVARVRWYVRIFDEVAAINLACYTTLGSSGAMKKYFVCL